MGLLRYLIITFGIIMTSVVKGQDVHGFICNPVVPENGQEVVDFSLKGSIGNTVWRYRFEGDSALHIISRGLTENVREDYKLQGDSAWLVCRECRTWISRDSCPPMTASPNATNGDLKRNVRRYMSEHYQGGGSYNFTPMGTCTVILTAGDTVRNATLTHRREVMEYAASDAGYQTLSDSLSAHVTKEIWSWGLSLLKPLLARTEITVTHNLRTGDMWSDEWTVVFPRSENIDIWPEFETSIGNIHNLNNVGGSIVPFHDSDSDHDTPLRNSSSSIMFSDGILTIDTQGTGQQVIVSDISGRVMHSCETSRTVTLNTGGWPYGEYIIKAGSVIQKLILVP